MGHGVVFKAEFFAQRAVMEEFRQVLLSTPANDPEYDWNGGRGLRLYRGKKAYRYNYRYPQEFNSNSLEHHPDCTVAAGESRLGTLSENLADEEIVMLRPQPRFDEPDWNPRAQELIEDIASRIEDESRLFRLLIREYKGFWWRALGNRTHGRMSFPGEESRQDRDLSHLLGGLDLLLPEAQQEMQRLVTEGLLDENRKSRSERGRNGSGRVGLIFVNRVRSILNRNLENCVHVTEISCILCGVRDTPFAGSLMDQELPQEICSWCLELFWYHPPPLLVRAGLGKKRLRTLMASAVIELVSLVDLPYWRENVLTKKFVTSLDLKSRSPKDAAEIICALSQLPRSEDISKFFGSKAKLLEFAGFEGHSQSTFGGHRSIATDGHLCLSIGERDICEFLFRNGVAHYKEPFYSTDPGVVADYGHLRGDFRIGDVVVEFAGLTGDSGYDAKMELKVALAETLNIQQIVLFPKDLGDLDQSLLKVLQAMGATTPTLGDIQVEPEN